VIHRKVHQDELEASERGIAASPHAKIELHRRNAKFIAAMAAAIRAGLERPPQVGIDRTPGTKNPLWVL
jgi:hypothetical protein